MLKLKQSDFGVDANPGDYYSRSPSSFSPLLLCGVSLGLFCVSPPLMKMDPEKHTGQLL